MPTDDILYDIADRLLDCMKDAGRAAEQEPERLALGGDESSMVPNMDAVKGRLVAILGELLSLQVVDGAPRRDRTSTP